MARAGDTDAGAARAASAGRATDLARRLHLPQVSWRASVTSTMDEAHALAEQGARAGTLVVADTQTRGRGRGGKAWSSPHGAGLWMTLIERPRDTSGLEVLSLRVGLRVAQVLDRFAQARVQLKWPNDLMLPTGKVAGILVEVRWREQRPEWVAIGIGVNLRRPDDQNGAAQLDEGGTRHELLEALVPAIRGAAAARGTLTAGELEDFEARDWARGRRVSSPAAGTVVGVSPAGAVRIATAAGTVSCASGSLTLEGEGG